MEPPLTSLLFHQLRRAFATTQATLGLNEVRQRIEPDQACFEAVCGQRHLVLTCDSEGNVRIELGVPNTIGAFSLYCDGAAAPRDSSVFRSWHDAEIVRAFVSPTVYLENFVGQVDGEVAAIADLPRGLLEQICSEMKREISHFFAHDDSLEVVFAPLFHDLRSPVTSFVRGILLLEGVANALPEPGSEHSGQICTVAACLGHCSECKCSYLPCLTPRCPRCISAVA